MNSGVQRRRSLGSQTTIGRETATLSYSSSRQEHVQDQHQSCTPKVLEETAPERTTTTQSRCCTTSSNMDAKYKHVHSDQSETTAETTCSSGGGGSVCRDDSRTTEDGTTSCSTSHDNTVISILMQMQDLYTVCPYSLDSADKLINLPDDLVRDVLGRVSPSEVVRMGCLSRSWRSEVQRLIDVEHTRLDLPADLVSLDRQHRERADRAWVLNAEVIKLKMLWKASLPAVSWPADLTRIADANSSEDGVARISRIL